MSLCGMDLPQLFLPPLSRARFGGHLLKMNPKDRYTAEQALNHEWIKNKAHPLGRHNMHHTSNEVSPAWPVVKL